MGIGQVAQFLAVLLAAVIGSFLEQTGRLQFGVPVCVSIVLIVLILLKMRADWLLHLEYVRVQQRELQRKPMGKPKTKAGRVMSQREAFARLNMAHIKTSPGEDAPPRMAVSLAVQFAALAGLVALLYTLLR